MTAWITEDQSTQDTLDNIENVLAVIDRPPAGH